MERTHVRCYEEINQCRCGLPGAQPQPPLLPPVAGLEGAVLAVFPVELEAKVENFFSSFSVPQWGHFVPSQSLERTRISLSRPHLPQ